MQIYYIGSLKAVSRMNLKPEVKKCLICDDGMYYITLSAMLYYKYTRFQKTIFRQEEFRMLQKLMKKTGALLLALCLLTGIAAVSAAEENLYTGGTVTQNEIADSHTQLISVPGLTKNFTFQGKVKIVEIGPKGYNGIRFVIGSDGSSSSELVVTKEIGTRIEFKGKNNINGTEIIEQSPALSDGLIFSFKIIRAGQKVTFYMDEALILELEIPDDGEYDAFVQGNNRNLGFTSSGCRFEVSEISVQCAEAAEAKPGPNLYTGGTVTNGSETTNVTMLNIPELTKNYTFKGHIKIISMAGNGWNGVRFINGYDSEEMMTNIVAMAAGTAFDFKGDSMSMQFNTTPLTAGYEFDFEIIREGQRLTYLMNGEFVVSILVPEALDAFTEGSASNLGFQSSDCHFEASNLAVYRNDITPPAETDPIDPPKETDPGETRENLYTGGSITSASVSDINRSMLTIPGLTDHYIYEGHVKITDIGTEPYHGIRLIIGADPESGKNCQLVITKDWDVRVEFKDDNMKDLMDGIGLRLSKGTEFDFKVEKEGLKVTLWLDGKLALTVEIPEALECFTAGHDQNLGFLSSGCAYEVSDIAVYGTVEIPVTGDCTALFAMAFGLTTAGVLYGFILRKRRRISAQ